MIPYEYKTYKSMVLPNSTWVDTGDDDDDNDDDKEEDDCMQVGRNMDSTELQDAFSRCSLRMERPPLELPASESEVPRCRLKLLICCLLQQRDLAEIMPRVCQKLMNTFAKIKLLGNCWMVRTMASEGLLILCQNEQFLEAVSEIVLRKPSLIKMYGNEKTWMKGTTLW